MKNEMKILRLSAILMAVLILSISCSKQLQTSKSESVILKYNFEQGTQYKYQNVSKIDQVILIGDQEIGALITSNMGFVITGVDSKDDEIGIKVRVDSITGSAQTMEGQITSDAKEVRGKEFNMAISFDGKEKRLEEAEKITYIGIGDQPSNLKASFTMLFSDMPLEAVKLGYTWTQSDTVDLTVGDQNAQIIIHSNNIIESREVVDGYDCFKITSTNTGERNASGNTPQGFMSQSGELTGTGILWFAPKEGIVIKEEVNQKYDGTLTLQTGDSFPMIMDIKIENRLIK